MADHLTEEEQIEAMKTWWKENWLSLVLPVVGGLFFYVGWNSWQDHKESKAQSGSDKYAALLSLIAPAQGQTNNELTDDQIASVNAQVDLILKEHSDSRYADLSHLMAAKVAMQKNDYSNAEKSLTSVLDSSKDDALKELANTRLIKVFLAKNDLDKAMSLIPTSVNKDFEAVYSELKGDVYFAQGKSALANAAYEFAAKNLSQEQFSRRGLIMLKLDNTNQAVAEESNAVNGTINNTPAEINVNESIAEGTQ